MEGLAATCCRATTARRELFGVRLHRFDAAVERALRDWEAAEAAGARHVTAARRAAVPVCTTRVR